LLCCDRMRCVFKAPDGKVKLPASRFAE